MELHEGLEYGYLVEENRFIEMFGINNEAEISLEKLECSPSFIFELSDENIPRKDEVCLQMLEFSPIFELLSDENNQTFPTNERAVQFVEKESTLRISNNLNPDSQIPKEKLKSPIKSPEKIPKNKKDTKKHPTKNIPKILSRFSQCKKHSHHTKFINRGDPTYLYCKECEDLYKGKTNVHYCCAFCYQNTGIITWMSKKQIGDHQSSNSTCQYRPKEKFVNCLQSFFCQKFFN